MNKSEKEIISILNPCYHTLYREISGKILYSDETVLYAADFSGNSTSSFVDFGFIVFTDRRYLKICASSDHIGKVYYQSGNNSLLGRMISGEKLERRYWVDPTVFCKFFLQRFDKSKEWKEIIRQEYSDIKGVTIRNYTLNDKNDHSVDLVEFGIDFYNRYGTWYKTFLARDGENIKQLINSAKANNGRVPLGTMTEPKNQEEDFAEMINALAKLHKVGILTDTEFKMKKKELLLRL